MAAGEIQIRSANALLAKVGISWCKFRNHRFADIQERVAELLPGSEYRPQPGKQGKAQNRKATTKSEPVLFIPKLTPEERISRNKAMYERQRGDYWEYRDDDRPYL